MDPELDIDQPPHPMGGYQKGVSRRAKIQIVQIILIQGKINFLPENSKTTSPMCLA
jgi:hypothetical protein